jgi:putative ABC transport system substrate-binding protein
MFRRRKDLVALAAKHRLPDFHYTSQFVEAGGLMSYAPSLPDNYRRAAVFVDKILKGVKPADRPDEQPAKFELVINLRTAKALGLSIPPAVLAGPDAIIQ